MAVHDAVLSASITTESSARASGDSANATLITSLTAAVSSIRVQAMPSRPAVASDFTASTTGSAASAANLTGGGYSVVAVANEGDVAQFTSGLFFRHKGYLPVVSGRTYRVRARVRVTVDGTSNRFQIGLRYLDSTFASVGTNAGTQDTNAVVADGWQTLEFTITGAAILTAASTAAYVTSRIATGVNGSGVSSGATTQVAWVELEDITDLETLEASVTVNASAIADIEGRLAASYSIQVDGGGNGALVSLEDGTTLGSVVKLAADKIELRADALDLGTDTTFEATHDTFYTTAGSYRFRYGGPFGTSSDLLQWYGPTSVSLNSETKTNGVFALATDGKVYLGTAELVSGGGANSKAVTQQNLDLDIDTSGTTWVVGSTFDMTVGTPGFLSVNNSSLGAGFTSAISAGSTFNGNWRITEATQADPTTKTVVWSGTFVADSGGGSVEVSGFVSPASPVLATKSGACRYTLEVQRASGTNNVTDLTSFLSLTWTPSG